MRVASASKHLPGTLAPTERTRFLMTKAGCNERVIPILHNCARRIPGGSAPTLTPEDNPSPSSGFIARDPSEVSTGTALELNPEMKRGLTPGKTSGLRSQPAFYSHGATVEFI